MKNALLLIFLFFAASATAQLTANDPKPAKLRMTPRFLTTKFEIGDKDVKHDDVQLHLEKHCAEAYYDFRRASTKASTGNVCLAVSLVGLAGGFFAQDNSTKLVCYTTALLGSSVGLVFALNSAKKYESSIDTYNKKFGY